MSMPPPPTATIAQEALAGLVERVTYHNAENGFCVLRLRAGGHRDLVTLVGHAAVVLAGEWINATGEWTNDRTHGQQFRAKFLKTAAPTSIDGIERYRLEGRTARNAEPVDPAIGTTHSGQRIVECVLLTGT